MKVLPIGISEETEKYIESLETENEQLQSQIESLLIELATLKQTFITENK
jgi:hypothetical protein